MMLLMVLLVMLMIMILVLMILMILIRCLRFQMTKDSRDGIHHRRIGALRGDCDQRFPRLYSSQTHWSVAW